MIVECLSRRGDACVPTSDIIFVSVDREHQYYADVRVASLPLSTKIISICDLNVEPSYLSWGKPRIHERSNC